MQAVARRHMEFSTSTIVAIAGSVFGVLGTMVAGFFAWRSKKDELLYKERQDRISDKADSAKLQAATTEATAKTGLEAMQQSFTILKEQVQLANDRAVRAETKANAAIEHSHRCDKQLAFLEAVAKLKGWPGLDERPVPVNDPPYTLEEEEHGRNSRD